MSVGLPAPQSVTAVCWMHGRTVWQRGHESVVQTWAEIAKAAGRGDIKFNLLGNNVTGAVGDISITHVALGSGPRREEWGSYKPGALADRVGSKNSTYILFHRDQNLEFLALVGTTQGKLSAVGVAMYHHLAHLAAEAAFEARGWPTAVRQGRGFSSLFYQMCSSFACRYGGRLVMALCRASGQRGLPRAEQGRATDDLPPNGDDLFGWD
eukprot:15418-Rhodomonas_salina.1